MSACAVREDLNGMKMLKLVTKPEIVCLIFLILYFRFFFIMIVHYRECTPDKKRHNSSQELSILF